MAVPLLRPIIFKLKGGQKSPLFDTKILETVGPYRICQDALNSTIELNAYRCGALQMLKMLSPMSNFYVKLCGDEYAKAVFGGAKAAELQRSLFKIEWVAMYDQIRVMGADIKANGGMFVFPNPYHFQNRLAAATMDDAILPALKDEFRQVMRECIAFNYYEMKRLNGSLADENQVVAEPRTKVHMARVAREVDKWYQSKYGK